MNNMHFAIMNFITVALNIATIKLTEDKKSRIMFAVCAILNTTCGILNVLKYLA